MFGFRTEGVHKMDEELRVKREEIRKARRDETLREQKRLRIRILIFCATLIFMFGMGVGFGTLLARAEETKKELSHKFYSNIQIQKGDTLWELAAEYMDYEHYRNRKEYILEVMRINHMTDDRLISGKMLIVPYYAKSRK